MRVLSYISLVPRIYGSETGQHCFNNGLSPISCQAIIWSSAGSLTIEPLGRNLKEILIKLQNFHYRDVPENIIYKMAAILSRSQFTHLWVMVLTSLVMFIRYILVCAYFLAF